MIYYIYDKEATVAFISYRCFSFLRMTMNYQEAMSYIEKANKRGSVYGLDTMRKLLSYLDNPQDRLQFIHVGGTNGKGSVSSYIATVLAKNGKKVGRYVSPTVFSYQEKIQYLSENQIIMMSEDETAATLTQVKTCVDRMKDDGCALPTVFEIETAMAFLLFIQWKVDVVVLEVGLGGLLDATNVVQNVIATVITPISVDHTRLLGDSVLKIAKEKAGIIKENHKVFAMQKDQEVIRLLEEYAICKHATIHFADPKAATIEEASVEKTVFSLDNTRYTTHMPGLYQVENAMLAIEVCKGLQLSFIKEGIQATRWPGRFEVIGQNPLLIIDGAHNVAGAKALGESIRCLLKGRKIYGIFGVFADKDYVGIAAEVVPLLTEVVTTQGEGERGLPPEKLAEVCRTYCEQVSAANSAKEALQYMRGKTDKEDVILAFGSLSFLKKLI